jgi:hypothetical protein
MKMQLNFRLIKLLSSFLSLILVMNVSENENLKQIIIFSEQDVRSISRRLSVKGD